MKEKSMNPSLQLILDIAEKLILEKGCRNTTLQEIAVQGGLTKGAIYHYVKSKDELFALILEAGQQQANQRFIDSVSDTASQKTGPLGPFESLSRSLHNLAGRENAANLIFIYLLSQKDSPAVTDILNRYYEASIQMTKRWIEVGKQHKAIPEYINEENAARMFAVFKNGLQIQNVLAPESGKIPDRDLYQFLLNALGVKDTSSQER
ncbi:TetR family transcriptional regulator [Paenibacillus sp. LMG 31456]|uniref:TetR family transcriptional regulator n=1 Tax=Paenibacillus foliorum TaxID=2654974 RepID=A0A972GN26_9BACL|nr:TetR/AcrR family transcriptional regulator [Paenibacillus foliorum]NOU93724.1 TetR family transcriptional regulator [Paenibacillus foliorum]